MKGRRETLAQLAPQAPRVEQVGLVRQEAPVALAVPALPEARVARAAPGAWGQPV